jgi:hypothetical protein
MTGVADYERVRALASGLVVAVVMASAARGLMRVVTLVELGQPEFSVSGTAGIVLLFAIAGLGGAAVARLAWRGWRRWTALVLTAGPLVYSGIAIGLSDLSDAAARGIPAPRLGVAGALFALIMALAVATPWLALRVGLRSSPLPASPHRMR